ncbi:DUF1127 domain-containing protein [Thalassospira sp. MCCC 1A01428]|uniref:DUF1127 domain-containing protein n=1 Tax=Thalassospira sp. MCCC 1A01428 TaxID=1470575 RepID=UPI00143D7750|nr:DUF1127 domain-containing protein [Thalassospira sp. MCCC 1A01428]
MSGYMPTTPHHFDTHRTMPSGVDARGTVSLQGWLLFLLGQWVKRRKVARDIAWLQRAPAHILHDIGLSRDEIERVCKTGHNHMPY